MKQAPTNVDYKINRFLKRKSEQFPEIDKIAHLITRSARAL